jgi:signal peptidase I
VLRLQWNALQVGDKVLVHDDADVSLRLQPGIVAMVQTAHDSNDLGVRVTGRSGQVSVVRPSRLSVHLDPRDATEECWRCDAIAARAAAGLEAAAASAP